MSTTKRTGQKIKRYIRTKPNVKQKAKNRLAYTIIEAARAAGFGQIATRKLVRSGELPSFRVGGKTYVLRSALREWIEQRGRGKAA